MREILFRGKRKDNGEWVYGDISQHKNGKKFIKCGSAIHSFEVVPETVGQFTGLTANGKKIFDGDMVDCWSEGVNAKGVVQQRIDGLWFIYPAWQKNTMWGLCPDEYGNTTVKVIGNIYDNQELVEVTNGID